MKRKFGKLNGWVGYTWSKTDRQFEDLNNGDPFPAKFDRRHDLSVVMDWTPSERWNLSAAFVYATGNTLTLPIQRYFLEGNITTSMARGTGTAWCPTTARDISAALPQKELRRPESGAPLGVQHLQPVQPRQPYFLFFDNEGDCWKGTWRSRPNK